MVSPLTTAKPLTPATFKDLETVFGARGCSFARGCWCMEYREEKKPVCGSAAELKALRKAELQKLARGRIAPGIIGYDKVDNPVGWVSLGPRGDYEKLQRSRVMKAVDGCPVWSIVCFVVPSEQRGKGIAGALLSHAIEYARKHQAPALEAYPIDKPERSQPQWLWHGTKGMFEEAGFTEIARRTPTRPVMRLFL